MKITIKLTDGRTVTAKEPYTGAVYVETQVECPSGGHYLDAQGVGAPDRSQHATVTSPARCCACKEVVGMITVRFDTLFGVEEDERVLNGRCRVY